MKPYPINRESSLLYLTKCFTTSNVESKNLPANSKIICENDHDHNDSIECSEDSRIYEEGHCEDNKKISVLDMDISVGKYSEERGNSPYTW